MLRSRVGYSTLDEYVERMAVDLDGQRVWGGIVEMIAFARLVFRGGLTCRPHHSNTIVT
jgi:hypothetical protein